MSNITLDGLVSNGIGPEGVAIIIGATASAIAAIVYSAKHIKSSSCFGGLCKCKQVVSDDPCEGISIREQTNV